MAGVALTHVLGYVTVPPRGAVPGQLMTESGHGWHHIAAVGGVAGALAVLGAFWCGLRQRSGRGPQPVRSMRFLTDLQPVALMQMALFGAIETTERVLAHEPLAELLQSRSFLVGLLLQAFVAFVVVSVLRAAEQAAARLSVGSTPSTSDFAQRLPDAPTAVLPSAAPQRPDCRGPPFGTLRLVT